MTQENYFLRKIPEDMRPWECNVNGVKYVYPAGTEQNVPAEVAAIIDAYWENQEVDYPETGISFNDLRDRPFGESPEVLFDQRVEFWVLEYVGGPGAAEINTELSISAGDLLKVTFDGVEYGVEVFPIDGVPNGLFFGNRTFLGGEDNGIPFATMTAKSEEGSLVSFMIAQTASAPEFHTIKIEKSVIHTIDPKFIPAGVGGGVVIVQDSAMASGIAVVDSDATATMNAAQIAEAIFAGKTVYFLEPNDGTLLPFVYGYRFGELASGVMTLDADPDHFALFGALDSGGYYHRITVYSDGVYYMDGFSVGS